MQSPGESRHPDKSFLLHWTVFSFLDFSWIYKVECDCTLSAAPSHQNVWVLVKCLLCDRQSRFPAERSWGRRYWPILFYSSGSTLIDFSTQFAFCFFCLSLLACFDSLDGFQLASRSSKKCLVCVCGHERSDYWRLHRPYSPPKYYYRNFIVYYGIYTIYIIYMI